MHLHKNTLTHPFLTLSIKVNYMLNILIIKETAWQNTTFINTLLTQYQLSGAKIITLGISINSLMKLFRYTQITH